MWGAASVRRLYLAIAILIAWSALALEFHHAVDQAVLNGNTVGEGIAHYFSSFTILANILAAFALIAAFFNGRETPHADVMAAIATYMAIVAGIYFGELHGTLETTQGLRVFTDATIHYLTPFVFVLYWAFFVQKGLLRWRAPFVWLCFPLVYLAVSLLRVVVTGYYPYPFLNVGAIGGAKVAINSLGLLTVFLGTGFAMVTLDKILDRRGAVA
jgi:hypothetical protein